METESTAGEKRKRTADLGVANLDSATRKSITRSTTIYPLRKKPYVSNFIHRHKLKHHITEDDDDVNHNYSYTEIQRTIKSISFLSMKIPRD
ncbi:hypothetical protein AVEN_35618-1 [Araneus ventricosus]|uniref:Uncharacterized protein n=1 Tax=Araneus ventricosus TaxID=182803 RepID=A0A4Y2X1R3_ARAVE|nr:hypothetical protein AVEN_35618-1 [Araneus ventricosus]